MAEDTYLFIDGAQLKIIYRDRFYPIFGDSYPIDFAKLRDTFHARRVYYYDCIDNVPKEGEKEDDFRARVERQENLFDEIDKKEGVHVRRGWLSPGTKKQKQQKEVDVLLAVDMLTHSFNRNMTKAVLLSGDRDFRPLIESVVRLGTYVQVAYDPRIGSKDLAREADSEMEIKIDLLCSWVKLNPYELITKHFPQITRYPNVDRDPALGLNPAPIFSRAGSIGSGKQPLRLYQGGPVTYASVNTQYLDFEMVHCFDQTKLLGFMEQMYGSIAWE